MHTLSHIYSKYIDSLQTLYSQQEAQSIAYLAAEHVLGVNRLSLRQRVDTALTDTELAALTNILQALTKGTPIQYVLGETEFYSLPFKVNPSVLIPRPETEELVHWILNDNKHNNNINLLDIGTGSGCIPISLKHNRPQWNISAIDISEEALVTAKQNAELNKVSVNFLQTDILRVEKFEIRNSKFEIIVSNPPYVLDSERISMHENVLHYEPDLAIFVEDADPLKFYKAIANFAKTVLLPGGMLYFEINESKGPETVKMLAEKGFENIELRKDLRDTDRMIRAELK